MRDNGLETTTVNKLLFIRSCSSWHFL